MAATCMAVCKGSRKKIRGIFISSCHLPAAVECDIVILSEPGPNPTGPSWAVLQHNLSPRGDGNIVTKIRGNMAPRHNLSPRGDGNVAEEQAAPAQQDTTYPREGTETAPADAGPRNQQTQLIPARGRKLRDLHPRKRNSFDTTYPREGTETVSHSLSIPPITGHNLSPRGDGNNFVKLSDAPIAEDTTYPREGMETFCQHISYPLFQRYNLSP